MSDQTPVPADVARKLSEIPAALDRLGQAIGTTVSGRPSQEMLQRLAELPAKMEAFGRANGPGRISEHFQSGSVSAASQLPGPGKNPVAGQAPDVMEAMAPFSDRLATLAANLDRVKHIGESFSRLQESLGRLQGPSPVPNVIDQGRLPGPPARLHEMMDAFGRVHGPRRPIDLPSGEVPQALRGPRPPMDHLDSPSVRLPVSLPSSEVPRPRGLPNGSAFGPRMTDLPEPRVPFLRHLADLHETRVPGPPKMTQAFEGMSVPIGMQKTLLPKTDDAREESQAGRSSEQARELVEVLEEVRDALKALTAERRQPGPGQEQHGDRAPVANPGKSAPPSPTGGRSGKGPGGDTEEIFRKFGSVLKVAEAIA